MMAQVFQIVVVDADGDGCDVGDGNCDGEGNCDRDIDVDDDFA